MGVRPYIIHTYIQCDSNGKRNSWETVVKIPFIDEKDLFNGEPCSNVCKYTVLDFVLFLARHTTRFRLQCLLRYDRCTYSKATVTPVQSVVCRLSSTHKVWQEA